MLAAAAMGTAAVAGAMVMTAPTANADTTIDPNTIQVDAGDNLTKIAANHGTTVDNLAQVNGIQNVNLIHVGDRLKITQANNAVQSQAPAQTQQTAQQPQVAQTTQAVQSQPVAQTTNSSYQAPSLSGSEQAAKDWIAQRESGGNYNATNGQYIGKYQLSSSYLNGDYSPANQERVAQDYVNQRYGGSWQTAQAHWMANGWY